MSSLSQIAAFTERLKVLYDGLSASGHRGDVDGVQTNIQIGGRTSVASNALEPIPLEHQKPESGADLTLVFFETPNHDGFEYGFGQRFSGRCRRNRPPHLGFVFIAIGGHILEVLKQLFHRNLGGFDAR